MREVRIPAAGRGIVHVRRSPSSIMGLGAPTGTFAAWATSIWSDWMEFVPVPDTADRVRDAFLVLRDAEEQTLRTADAYIARHNAGRMTLAEYGEYDGMRTDIHERQVAMHRLLRQSCYNVLGRALGDQVIAQVPWPGWLPRIRPGIGRVAPIAAAGLGAPPLVIAGIVLALVALAAVLVSNAVDYQREVGATLVAQARARALADALSMRERLYNDCVARGGDTTSCLQQATAATSDAIDAIRDIRRQYEDQRRRLLLRAFVPFAAGVATVAGVAVWIKVRRARNRRA